MVGKTTSEIFNETFPTIATIQVVLERRFGRITRRAETIDASGITDIIACHNLRCVKGGFFIWHILHEMASRKQTYRQDLATCQGYERSPEGKRKFGVCMAMFDYTVDITYKP